MVVMWWCCRGIAVVCGGVVDGFVVLVVVSMFFNRLIDGSSSVWRSSGGE